jgi:hypothetical protein
MVKFMRARAGALGFAATSPPPRRSTRVLQDDLDNEEEKADLDVLPTILVYQSGQLMHTWIRADWVVSEEVGRDIGSSNGLARLLERYLPRLTQIVD